MEMKYDRIAAGERLQRRREALGLSRQETAGKIGKAENYYADIEQGSCGMSVGTLAALSKVLHMPVDSIIYGKDTGECQEENFYNRENIAWFTMLDSLDKNKRKNVKELVEKFIVYMEGS